MRLSLLLAAALAPGAAGAVPAVPAVRRWLALDAVDARARVPFNANVPFRRYLLDRAASPPQAGDRVEGGTWMKDWRVVEARDDGKVDDPGGAWFYGEIEGPAGAETVHLAHLDGASTLFVNGAAFPGDVYKLKTGGVPVALRPGTNRIFVAGPRGPWSLRFEPWESGRSPFLAEDATLPDAVERAAPAPEWIARRVVNPTLDWSPNGPPLWTGKTAEQMVPKQEGVKSWIAGVLPLEVRASGAARRVTFRSRMDGSVQFYGYLPPAPAEVPPQRMGIVLSLHGAGVDALEQARCYAPKQDFRIVAPTNRRPFGFDWQGWGARDALEAMDDAERAFPDRGGQRFLTGHSMGGHGTWHLAALHPRLWEGIAPSAGWCSFDTYPGPRPETPLTGLWRAADGGSRTEDMIGNLGGIPAFVLHGTADESVPVTEAEDMVRRVGSVGRPPRTRFQPGAAHWWDRDAGDKGVDCVDWPGIFDLFRKTPAGGRDRRWIDITTLDTSLQDRRADVLISQPLVYGRPSRIWGTVSDDAYTLATHNARRLTLGRPDIGRNTTIAIDDTILELPAGSVSIHLERIGDTWGPAEPPAFPEKDGPFGGPFLRAFDERFVLVVGTKGSEAENRESMELARYHAATWWYRANGNAPVVRDADLLARPGEFARRNLVLYGNADTNAAWERVVPASSPLKARRGAITLGPRSWSGDGLGAVFVQPRADGGGLVGAFAATGPRGTRIGYGLLPFLSGVGYPDYAVFGAEYLDHGDGGVLAAGWFDHRWALQPGGHLREDPE